MLDPILDSGAPRPQHGQSRARSAKPNGSMQMPTRAS